MKQLEQFFLLIDQCLNDTEFIRKHALSEKDFTRNRILTFRNTFWGLLAHTGASLQSEIPLLTRKFCGEIPLVSPQAFSKARNKMNYTSCKEFFDFSTKNYFFTSNIRDIFLLLLMHPKFFHQILLKSETSLVLVGINFQNAQEHWSRCFTILYPITL